jgi:hypothetical protein
MIFLKTWKGSYLSILSPARPSPLARPAPGPPTNLTGWAWAEILKPAKKFLARARPEMLFLVVLHYKCAGGPIKPGPSPSPARKVRPDTFSGMVMGRIFSARNNRNFFDPARPEKYSPLKGLPRHFKWRYWLRSTLQCPILYEICST